MRMPFFTKRNDAQHEEELQRSTVVVKVGDAIGEAWAQAWARSHAEQAGDEDGVPCLQGGDSGSGGGGDLERMRTAGAVTDQLFSIYGRTEAGILQSDPTLGPQKCFLLKLFRPLIVTMSFHGTTLLYESDFVECDRRKLVFDEVLKLAWPAPTTWTWREAERTICQQLSKNSKTLPILINDVMRTMRTEYAMSVEAAPELSKYLALRTEEEIQGKVSEYQSYEPQYYIVKYFQISAETEARQVEEEAINAAEQMSFSGRLLIQNYMLAYSKAIRRHGERSVKVEAAIEAGLKIWAPEFLPTWRQMIADITPHYPPVPASVGTGITDTNNTMTGKKGGEK